VDKYLNFDQKRVLAEVDWRKSLKSGDKLDCLRSQRVGHHALTHWVPSTLVRFATEEDLIDKAYTQDDLEQNMKMVVSFDGVPPSDITVIYSKDSVLIA
jgi:hypothetical protein